MNAVPAGALAAVLPTVLPALLAAAAAACAVGLPAPDRLSRLLLARPRQAAANVPLLPAPPPRWTSSLTAAAPALAAAVGLLVRGPAAGVLAALAAVCIRRSVRRRATRATRTAERSGALEASACLSTELRAGRTSPDALALAAAAASGQLAAVLGEAATAARMGADVPPILLKAAADSAAPELLRGLAACWQVCSTSGSGLAAAVDRLGEGLRQAQAQRRDVDAELAGPRATAGLLAALPLAGIALASALGAQPVHLLLDTPLGAGCLAAGLGLDGIGVWWTGRIVVAAGGAQ